MPDYEQSDRTRVGYTSPHATKY